MVGGHNSIEIWPGHTDVDVRNPKTSPIIMGYTSAYVDINPSYTQDYILLPVYVNVPGTTRGVWWKTVFQGPTSEQKAGNLKPMLDNLLKRGLVGLITNQLYIGGGFPGYPSYPDPLVAKDFNPADMSQRFAALLNGDPIPLSNAPGFIELEEIISFGG